jgi:hypothetical protein
MPAARNLEEALTNIRDPHRWANAVTIFNVVRQNPSLRGIVYGYAAELHDE